MRIATWCFAAAAASLLPTAASAQTTPPPAQGTGATVGVTAGGTDAAAPTTPPPATPPAVAAGPARTWRDAITLEGFMDTYYSFRPGGGGTEDAGYHVFDVGSNSFVVAYTELALAVKPEPVGLRLDLGFGPVADITASNLPLGLEVFKHLQQAYVSFAIPSGVPLTLDVGKFVTSAGAEVIESRSNWNYSRSFLFGYAIPFTHTGLRLTAPVTSALTLQLMVANGWDVVYDNNAGKTFGVSATFTAPTKTTIILNAMTGPEPLGLAANPWRSLVDLVVTQSVGPLGLMLNFDYGHQDDANWWGIAAYARLAINEHLNLSLRGEHFADPEGFRLVQPGNTRVDEFTVTAGFPVGSNAEVRAEFRGDFSNNPIFVVDGDGKTSQFQLLASALAWF